MLLQGLIYLDIMGTGWKNHYGWNVAKAEIKLGHWDCQGEPWRDLLLPCCWNKDLQLPGEVFVIVV